jgi:sulfopropanediol 3-dehydrogenase
VQFTPSLLESLAGRFTVVKAPARVDPPAQRDPSVVATVSAMLSEIEARGLDAVREYAAKLDSFSGCDFELGADRIAASGDLLPPQLRSAIELGAERTARFAGLQREHLGDFETELLPGLVVGQRYVPVGSVGAYLPAGRFPLTASAFMTVNVAKVAGVPSVIACTPPQPDGGPNPAVLYAAHVSGVHRAYLLGGVQALAAMAFGLLGEPPVDMLVGAGNAYVAEAKRQLFGRSAIDLLAGPSEVAVIADGSADPELVAADLLGQAEHGPQSPAALVTTDLGLAEAVACEVQRQLPTLSTSDICGPAWENYGSITVAEDRETAVLLMDDLAPEHLEIQTSDDGWYHDHLHNYGSLFLGTWSTVAYSDKGMAGTNHVLPTAGGARHSAGLSVSRFLKPLTYQRISKHATHELADAVDVISESEGMSAHRATATLRKDRLDSGDDAPAAVAHVPSTQAAGNGRVMPADFRIAVARGRGSDTARAARARGGRVQPLRGFDETYTDIVDYIVRATHRIWEDQDVGYIYDAYAPGCRVHDDSGTFVGVEHVVEATMAAVHAFPDTRSWADEVIWAGDDEHGFVTSHRYVTTGDHLGAWRWGPATGRKVDLWGIAECLVRENEIYEEWVLYNMVSRLTQLGIDPKWAARIHGNERNRTEIDFHDAEVQRLVGGRAPEYFPEQQGREVDVDHFVRALWHNLYNRRDLSSVDRAYVPTVRWWGTSDRVGYGREDVKGMARALLATFPDLGMQVDAVHWMGNEADGYRVSVRWTAQGTHRGHALYGEPTNRRVRLWGINHLYLSAGRIIEDWQMFNEFDVMAQILRDEPSVVFP